MKKIPLILIILTLIVNTSFKNADTYLVKVQLKNIRAFEGTAYVNLYGSKGFPKSGEQLQRKSVKIKGSTATVTFSVPNGTYAVAMYHDVNDNDKMDKNWIGYPLEPYGFSRNFKPTISEPDFADCKFTINNASKTLSIDLIQ